MTTTTSSTTTTTTDPMAWATPGTIALIVIGVIVLVVLLRYIMRQRDAARPTAPAVTLAESVPVAPAVAPSPPPLADDIAMVDVPPTVATAPIASPPPPAESPQPAPPPLADDVATVDAADDLTRLKGVGPKLAAQLAGLGYARFAQIAALSPADADALDAQLGSFKGRLHRDRWVEQAGFLAKGDTAGFEAAFGKL